MKRFMCGLLVAGMTLACAPTAFANNKITVNVDKDELVFDVEPQIINDRLMVPMRVIFEKLNAKVDYIEAEKAVVSQKGDKTIRFVINSDYMEIKDGNSETKKIALDSPATIIDGRTLVPARAVAESFGCGVSWDGNTRTVQINTDGTVSNQEPKKEGKWVVTKETSYMNDGSVSSYAKYEYDGNGRKTKGTTYRPDRSVTGMNEYGYDSAGNMTKESHYRSDGSLGDWFEYEYDGNGKKTKCNVHDSYSSYTPEYKYEYDSNGRLTKTTYYENGRAQQWIEYEYNNGENSTTETYYNFDGGVTNFSFYEYEYDNNGNVTKMTESRWGSYTIYEYTYIQ
ncbi:MAG: hypothetical protein IKD83_07220 [Firmicutes bacterium]|nr:hypothetical protein [Bacillota bacterium]